MIYIIIGTVLRARLVDQVHYNRVHSGTCSRVGVSQSRLSAIHHVTVWLNTDKNITIWLSANCAVQLAWLGSDLRANSLPITVLH